MSLSRWKAIVLAAGMARPKMSSFEVYELAGKILHDPIVSARRIEMGKHEPSEVKTRRVLGELDELEPMRLSFDELEQIRQRLASQPSSVDVLRSMTPQERVALRERVAGVLKFARKAEEPKSDSAND